MGIMDNKGKHRVMAKYSDCPGIYFHDQTLFCHSRGRHVTVCVTDRHTGEVPQTLTILDSYE